MMIAIWILGLFVLLAIVYALHLAVDNYDFKTENEYLQAKSVADAKQIDELSEKVDLLEDKIGKRNNMLDTMNANAEEAAARIKHLQNKGVADAEVIDQLTEQVAELEGKLAKIKPHKEVIKAPSAAFIRKKVAERNRKELEERDGN